MSVETFAVLADVHGNALALEAVLADIRLRGVSKVINLGDNANGPLEPARCVALLRDSGSIHVRGNGDRMTGEGGAAMRGSARFARERLDETALRWLRELPFEAAGPGWLAFHASRRGDEEYLTENVIAGRVVAASPSEIAHRLGPTSATLILCGHTHLPRAIELEGGRLIVNPGSVGLPAYADSIPVPHVIENASPDARYAIVRGDRQRWDVELLAVPYDHAAAAAQARRHGWDGWAHSLETGRVAAVGG